jgi:hypothetical protein
MIYLSGHIHDSLYGVPNLGFMMTPRMGNRPDLSVMKWAADTGCFTMPESFSQADYFLWLEKFPKRTCLFATAPDRLGDWIATRDVSRYVLTKLSAFGYRPALVAQDGLEPVNVDWNLFDCLFIGGTTEWKESRHAEKLARETKRRGKWLHMGRVNSLRRMQIARDWGCDSVDGTYLAFGRDTLRPNLEWWLKWTNDQGQFAY